MADTGWKLFVCLIACYLSCSASTEPQVIVVERGDDVILLCQGPRDPDIELLEWIKPDLDSEDYVFFYRERQDYKDYQNPSFHGRVKLMDPTIRNGNFSVILKNVGTNDRGTYECRIGKSSSGRSKRAEPELVSTITLKVEEPKPDHIQIEAKYGERVVLPCQGSSNIPVKDAEWVRPDLIQAGTVFMTHGGRPIPDNQHPFYKNWVELEDGEMKDRDASLVLKYAMTVDSGTYECYVDQGGTKRKKRSVHLLVPPGHSQDGAN